VESLNAVDEKANMVDVSGYWRMTWLDQRLNFSSVGDGGCFDKLSLPLKGNCEKPFQCRAAWSPDLYFTNALEESYGSSFFEVYPTGLVYASVEIKHSFKCVMDFSRMPFDSQLCTIKMMSYSEDGSEVQLAAKDGIGIVLEEGGVYLPSWSVTGTSVRHETLQYGTGSTIRYWHAMKLDIAIKRSSGYHIMNDVIYGILFVAMSWTGFFVNRTNAPARVTISLLPVLTMLNHIKGIQTELPRISEMTWLSTFLLVSLMYNIAAVLEYGIVSFLMSREDRRTGRLRVLRALSEQLGEVYAEQLTMRTMSRRSVRSVSRTVCVDEDEEEEDTPPVLEMSSTLSGLDVSNLLPMQQRMVQDSMKLFDPKGDGFVTRARLRGGLRHFNIYHTVEQVTEIFGKMGLADDDRMPRRKFLKYLKSMPEPTPTMDHGFLDQPPSVVLDSVMRYAFILSYIVVVSALFPLADTFGTYRLRSGPP
jgi:hypothetical protein